MNRPKLSVIMPVYNAEKYLEESVRSVLGQSFTDFELILVDDKSTDTSGQIADRLSHQDRRIKVFHLPENKGPGIARNVALDYADGDYCTFVDSDDKIHPDMYRIMYDYAAANSLDIVRCEMGRFSNADPVPTPVFQRYGSYRIFNDRQQLSQMALCTFASPVDPERENLNVGGSACSAIFHRTLFENGGVRFCKREHMISEDFIFCYKTLLRAKSVGLVPESLYYYRFNPKSRSNIPRQDIIQRAVATAELMSDMIREDGFPESEQVFALQYTIDIIRAFVKNFFLSDMPVKEMRKWFLSQHDYPILERCRREFPLHLLPRLHRIHFLAFYHKKFYLLYSLVRGREFARKFL